MEPPEAIEADRRGAQWHFTLEVETLAPVDASGGGLHRCRAEGRVVAVDRTGPAHPLAPRAGGRFAVEVWCWPAARRAVEPPGPSRVHYGPGAPLPRLEIFGSIAGDRFVVATFHEPVSNSGGTMRSRLEAAYAAMKRASASRQEAALKDAITTRAYDDVKANLVRMGTGFTPEMVEAYGDELPALDGLEFVEVQEQGTAAALLYRGAGEDDGSGEARVRFVWVKLVEAGGAWKYDAVVEIEVIAVQPDGSATHFDVADVPAELRL